MALLSPKSSRTPYSVFRTRRLPTSSWEPAILLDEPPQIFDLTGVAHIESF